LREENPSKSNKIIKSDQLLGE
jgi:hypothetical protein